MSYPWDDAAVWHADAAEDELAGGRPYVQRAPCDECKVGTLQTLPPEEAGVPRSTGTVWACDTCRLVRLVPVMTPQVAAKQLLWGRDGLPRQWMRTATP